MIEEITFTRHDDGSVTVDRFPEEIAVSEELLAADATDLRAAWFRLDGERLYITAANGEATYINRGAEYPRAVRFARLYARGAAAAR